MNDIIAKKKAELIAQKQAVTARISETTRFVGFGLLAIYFAVKTAESGFASEVNSKFPLLVTILGACGAAAILLDYLQYWFGSQSVSEALKRETADYNSDSFWYRARGATFLLKQLAAILGSLILISLFALG